MVQLQIISRVLQTQNYNIIEDNQLTVDYFNGYEDEFTFLKNHYDKYGNVPDKATFLSSFPDMEIVEVNESEDYLINTIREEHLYLQCVPMIQKSANLLKSDSNAAVEYLLNTIKGLNVSYDLGGTDIIQNGIDRLKAFQDRRDNQDNWFFTTGFKELDDIIHGLQRGEELLVLFARTNQGKSWVLEKICTHIWEIGFNVGYISPEMSALSVGYRFDTLYKNFSNTDLMWGNEKFNEKQYAEYIDNLKSHNNKFIVSTPKEDFQNSITISKLRNYVKKYKLDALAIDGITYLKDERAKRGDNKTISLTNISEDLMSLSIELNIPIMVVVQANRNGAVDKENEDTPELESIRDSDGISHNASKVISIKQNNDNVLLMQVKKQRNGKVGGKVSYQWNTNVGEFLYVGGDSIKTENSKPKKKKEVQEKEDVF